MNTQEMKETLNNKSFSFPPIIIYPLLFVTAVFSFCPCASGEEFNKDFLKTLPAAEQAIADEVDHWGLPFSDQLRRFKQGQSAFKQKLGPKAPNNFIVGIQHGIEKIPLNKYWFKGEFTNQIHIDAAINEYENFQVAVLPDISKELKKVTLVCGDLHHQNNKVVIPAKNIKIYRVGYVKTIPARYTSLYQGLWPDYLLENAAIEIKGTDMGLFWIEVKVPANASAGDYNGQLTLQADGESVSIELTLHVYNFTLPDRVPFPIAAWTSTTKPDGKTMDVAEYQQLLGEFLNHGVDPISIGSQFCQPDSNDFSKLDENLEYCLKRGLRAFEIGSGKQYKENPDTLKPLVEHLRQKGWLDKAIFYSNEDEPDISLFQQRNIPCYKKVKTLYPDLKVFLASEYHPNIDHGCDIWMTDVSTGSSEILDKTSFGKAQRWFYYCHLPIRVNLYRPLVQAPNMLIDNEAIEHRLAFWLAWKYKTTGMFIWAGNSQWSKLGITNDANQNMQVALPDKPYPFPYAGIHNGNGFLIYPGPNPSVRLKIIRDGLEDYGYLMKLSEAIKKTKDEAKLRQAEDLLSIPAEVLIDPHYFNRDPKVILQTRGKIAKLIETLNK